MYQSKKINLDFYILKFITSLILCLSVTSSSSHAGQCIWRQTGPEVPELSAFDETMKEFMTSRNVSAGALALTYRSRLVFARGYTWAGRPCYLDSAKCRESAIDGNHYTGHKC